MKLTYFTVKSATGLASNAELNLAGNEIIKSYHIKKRIISNIKKGVGGYALIH